MPTTKPAWQSKTLLINGVLGLAAFAALFIPAASGVKALIEGHASEIALGWSVLNMILRTITKDKVVLGE